MTKPSEPKKRQLVLGLLFVPLVLFVMFRMLVIAPKFFPYFISVVILTFLFFLFGKKFHRTVARKCPKCGGPMNNMGVSKVFRGSLNKDGGSNFPSLGKKILRCLDCENEYYELIYYSASSGDAIDHRSLDDTKLEVAQVIYRAEMPLSIKNIQHKSITEQEYAEVKKKLAHEVTENNMRAGFSDNGIRIDLE